MTNRWQIRTTAPFDKARFLDFADPGIHAVDARFALELVVPQQEESIGNKLVEVSAAMRSATPSGEDLPAPQLADQTVRQIILKVGGDMNVTGDVLLIEGTGNHVRQEPQADGSELGLWARYKYALAGIGAVATVAEAIWGFFT